MKFLYNVGYLTEGTKNQEMKIKMQKIQDTFEKKLFFNDKHTK